MMQLEKGKEEEESRCSNSNMQTLLYPTLEMRIGAQWIFLYWEKRSKDFESLSPVAFSVNQPIEKSHNFGGQDIMFGR